MGCEPSRSLPEDRKCGDAPVNCSLRDSGAYEDGVEEEADHDFSDSLRLKPRLSNEPTRESLMGSDYGSEASEASSAQLAPLQSSPPRCFKAAEASSALDTAGLACVEISTREMMEKLLHTARSEERHPQLLSTYSEVLHHALDIIMSCIVDVSGGHLMIAVMQEAELDGLDVMHLDNGVLSDHLASSTVEDRPFQKRVWFYKSWIQQYGIPVQGGFVVDRNSGRILEAAAVVMGGANPMTPATLARNLRHGVVFARSELAGVRVYPAADVRSGHCYKVTDVAMFDAEVHNLQRAQASFLMFPTIQP